ncbi:MAG: hypothetical protein K5854_01575 [Prevotella sp.]|nr:hypothetical protein [Prevotella sp.]
MSWFRDVEIIAKRLNAQIGEESTLTMETMAYRLRDLALEQAKFHNITGNMINSYAVGCFLDGKLRMVVTSNEVLKDPTRLTLKKGETYDLPYYWGGDENAGFTGSIGDANYSGPEQAWKFIQSHAPTKKGWAYIVVNAVDYAKYVEAKQGRNVMTTLCKTLQADGAIVSKMQIE